MMSDADTPIREVVEDIYRSESRRVLATLIRLFGDFDVAEEALHDAFVAALEKRPTTGVPANPRTWLVSAGRFKAIDHLRRRAVFDERIVAVAREWADENADESGDGSGDGSQPDSTIDDRLRLIFTCC